MTVVCFDSASLCGSEGAAILRVGRSKKHRNDGTGEELAGIVAV